MTYNHIKYIRDAFDSIINQVTNYDFEIIVIDDCSTDGTSEVVKEYQKTYPDIISSYILNENVGRGRLALFKANPNVRGRYWCHLEADDYWLGQDKIQRQLSFLEENSDYIACTHAYIIKNEVEKTEIIHQAALKDWTIEDMVKGEYQLYSHTSTWVWRNLYKQYGNLHLPLSMKEVDTLGDVCMSFFMANHGGKIRRLDEVMSCYRYTGKGVWSSLSLEEQSKMNGELYGKLDKITDYKYSGQFHWLVMDKHIEPMLDEQVMDLLDRGSYTEAISLLESQLVKAMKNPKVLTLLGLAYFKLGNADKALQYLEMSKKLDESIVLTFDTLGDIYLQSGNIVNALNHYRFGLVKGSCNVELMHKIKAVNEMVVSQSYFDFFPVMGLKKYCQNGNAKLREIDLTNNSGISLNSEVLPGTYVTELKNAHAIGQHGTLFSYDMTCLVDDQDLAEVDRSDLVSVTQSRNLLGFAVAPGEGAVDKVLAEIPKDIIHIKKCIVLSCRASDNYFHWLIETLPKWLLIESCDEYKNFPLLINAHMPEQHYQALKILVGDKRQIIGAKVGENYCIGKAIVPSKLSRICFDPLPKVVLTTEDAYYHPAAVAFLQERFKKNNTLEPVRKIYLSRRSSQLKMRKMLNQQEVEAVFIQQGYEMVDMRELSFEQQIVLFESASHIAGVSGASFSNLIFANKGCHVILLTQSGVNSQVIYENLAQSIGISKFFSVLGDVTNNSHITVQSDFIINLETLQTYLN